MGVVLRKGDRVDLEENTGLSRISVGVNWGAIERRGFFRRKILEPVDLDLAAGLFHRDRSLIETIYCEKAVSIDNAIVHSGDDEFGNLDGDNHQDNETITADLVKLRPAVSHIVFVLHSFQWQTFDEIPYAYITVYDETNGQREVMVTLKIERNEAFQGKVSMILGKVYRAKVGDSCQWKFHAIGEPTEDRDLVDIMRNVSINHLSVAEVINPLSVATRPLSSSMSPVGM